MTNVNVSEKAWKTIKTHATPGESFAKTLDRVLKEWHYGVELIKLLDKEAIADLRKVGESKEEN